MEKQRHNVLLKLGVFFMTLFYFSNQIIAQCPTCASIPDITVELDNNGTATINSGFILGDQLELGESGAMSAINSEICVNVTSDFSFSWNLTVADPNQDLFFYSIGGGPLINLSDAPSFPSSGTQHITGTGQFCLTAINDAVATIQILSGFTGDFLPSNWTSMSGPLPNFNTNSTCTIVTTGTTLDLTATPTFDCADVGSNSYNVILDNGTTTEPCNITIIVEDNIDPEIDLATIPSYLNPVQCDDIDAELMTTYNIIANDNCTVQSVTELTPISTKGTDPTIASFYNYTVTRRWEAIDNNGNSSIEESLITVTDNDPSVFSPALPTTLTVTADPITCTATISLSGTAIDNCIPVATLPTLISHNSSFAANGNASFDASGEYPIGPHTVVFSISQPSGLPDVMHTVDIMVNNPGGGSTLSGSVTNVVDVVCNGGSTGSIDITPTGGSGTNTYLWSNGSTTEDLMNIPAGFYNVTIDDGSAGCSSFVISGIEIENLNDPIIVNSVTSTPASCTGLFDGSVSIDIQGGPSDPSSLGTGTYDIELDNGINPMFTYTVSGGVAVLSGLPQGSYTVTIKDDLNNSCTTTTSIIVNANALITINSTPADVGCAGDATGSINITASGGTGNYTYTWFGPSINAMNINNEDVTNLSAGSYFVSVSNSNNTCGTLSSPITIGTTNSTFTLTATSTDNVLCNGMNTGSISTNLGGTINGPHIYNWADGMGNPLPQTTPVISGLADDTYSVTVTDANGCTRSEANIPVMVGQPLTLSPVAGITDVFCNGESTGAISIVTTNGQGMLTYNWVGTNTGAINQDTPNPTGLAADTYSVTVTDNPNGCTVTASFTVNEPTTSVGLTISNVNNAQCNPSASGTLGGFTMNGTGGTAPYEFKIEDSNSAAIIDFSTNAPATSLTLNNTFTADTYTITVRDANGCTATTTQVISEPTNSFDVTLTTTNISCNGVTDGSISASVTGGTSPYIGYLWSNGINAPTATSITNLAGGTYTVTVTDSNGCTATQESTVMEPMTISASATSTPVTCMGNNDGLITVSIGGGTSPFSVSMTNGITTVNASEPTTTYTSTAALTPGLYNITVTDANNCMTTTSATIMESLAVLAVNSSSINTTDCNTPYDGAFSFDYSGGTGSGTIGDLNYSWSDGDMTQGGRNGLAPGTYTVTVTDDFGCTNVLSETISVGTSGFSLSLVPTQITCAGANDGILTLTVNGAPSSIASIQWMDGSLTGPNSNPNTMTVSRTGLIDGINYEVFVTDNSGCTLSASYMFTEPSPVNATITSQSNVECNGDATGSATAMGSGGTGTHTYLWSNSQITAVATGLSSGTYTVTVSDANGCTETNSVTINQPNALTNTTSVTQISTCMTGNGEISITGVDGTAPYNFTWSNGSNDSGVLTSFISNLSPGAYTVTITDTNGCTLTESNTIMQPSLDLAAIINSSQNTCIGGDGSAEVTASDGNPPYTYQWNDANAQTTAMVTGLNMMTPYVVTVTDNNGCTATASITLPGPSSGTQLGLNLVNNTPVECSGTGTGSLQVVGINGTPIYSYAWSDGQNTAEASGLVAGDYTVTITDADNCTTSQTFTVSQSTDVPTVIFDVINIDGCNTPLGQITANISGGQAPYNLLWSSSPFNFPNPVPSNPGSNTNFNLSEGLYTVIVTDANGCSVIGSTNVVEIPSLSLELEQTPDGCNGLSGSIDLTVTNGVAPYTYLWSNGQITEDVSGLSSGFYSVTVIDDTGCQKDANITVEDYSSSPININSNQTNVNCIGESTGRVEVNVFGGEPLPVNFPNNRYNFSWSTSLGTVMTEYNYSVLENVPAGTYTVTVTDANGCQETETVVITEPASAITPNISNVNHVDCQGNNNGSASANPLGGNSPFNNYGYQWSNGSFSQSIFNLVAGVYTVTVSDNNGCTSSEQVTITEPNALTISSISSNNVSCGGAADGSIMMTISGGTPPYSYDWDDDTSGDFDDPEDRTGLSGGTYNVTIRDDNGCIITNSVTITESSIIVVNVNSTNVVCFGESNGTATPTASNGATPYMYDWGTTDPTMLAAGIYTVTATDANGCTGIGSVNISEPDSLEVNANSSDALCFGESTGSAFAFGTGGTTPYSFDWGTGVDPTALAAGTYSVTLTDANMCTATTSVTISEPSAALAPNIDNFNDITCNGANDGNATSNPTGGTMPYDWVWSTGSASQSIFNLQPATYTVTVTDGNGCTSSEEVIITEPTVLTSTWMVTDALCNGAADGSIDFNVVGGTPPYTYDWDNDGTGDYDDPQDLSNLSPGTYNVTVQDANGCTVADVVPIAQPTNPLTIATTTSNVLCNGTTGSATATASGGTAPYIYDWGTATPTALAAGTYVVTATDANMCTATASVTITQPANALAVTATGTNILCGGSTTGTATATATGGTSPYTYDWGTIVPTGLGAGTYTVTVSDANMCSATASVTITEPTGLTATTVPTSIACSTGTGADIDLTVANGTSPYTYLWSTNATTEDLSGLGEGAYTVTITDANMCTITATATVTVDDMTLPFSTDCPSDTMIVNDPSSCGAIFTYATPTFNDNCDGMGIAGTLVSGLASGSLFPVGATAVTHEYTDVAGNGPVQCTFVVIVSDNEAPSFDTSDPNTPANGEVVVVDANGGCNAIYSWTSPLPVDNCSGATIISETYSSPVTLPLGIYVDSIIVQDAAGNLDTMAFTFQIQDLSGTPPTAICLNNIAITIPAGQSDIVIDPNLIDNGSFGNCGPVTVSVSPNTFTCAQADGVTPYNITMTVTDMNGLSTTCNTSIIVQENSAPTMVCQDITVELDGNGNAFITTDTIDNGSFDDCTGLASLSLDVTSFNASNVGVANQVTLTGTDMNGNSASCTANVTVEIPKPCLDIPDDFMVGTGTNCIPVTVTNFTNVRSFQQSIYIDPSVAVFTGICSHNLPVAPNVSVDNDTLTISYFNNATTLLNGDVIFEIQIDVVGALNSSSDIIVGNDPTPQEMIVEYGGTLFTLSTPFCSTQDGSINVTNSSLSATGNVRTWDLTDPNGTVLMMTQPVNNVDIFKTENAGPLALGGTTDIDGNYAISVGNLSGGISLEMTPIKNVNWLNYDPFPVPATGPSFQGVTSFDLFTIQQHIVTNAPLISNYQLIAADANADGQISTLDLVLLQDIIVGNSSSISSNQSWRFVPASDSLHNDPLPFLPGVPAYNDPISYSGFTSNVSDVDWIAVKIGNVIGPVVTSNLTGPTVDTRNESDLQFVIEDQKVKTGELLEIPFLAKDFKHVASQFTFEFNESILRYESMVSNTLSNFTEGNLGLDFADNGKLSVVWYAMNLEDIADDEVLFTLQFEVLEDAKSLSDLLSISNRLVKSEAYQLDGSVGDVTISFLTPTVTLPSTFELYQNQPNPFSEKTMISFNLEETGFAKLTLFDLSGRTLKVVEGDYEKGFNQVEILRSDLPASGVIYYQLESAENTATKKMIVLK